MSALLDLKWIDRIGGLGKGALKVVYEDIILECWRPRECQEEMSCERLFERV